MISEGVYRGPPRSNRTSASGSFSPSNDRFAEPVANYAYLRVSTHTQDVENQKLSVLDYCNSQGIAPIEFVEDTTSGRRSWRDREIGRLLETAAAVCRGGSGERRYTEHGDARRSR